MEEVKIYVVPGDPIYALSLYQKLLYANQIKYNMQPYFNVLLEAIFLNDFLNKLICNSRKMVSFRNVNNN